MSVNNEPPVKINDCTACYGTGIQGWIHGEEYEVKSCDQCDGKVTLQ